MWFVMRFVVEVVDGDGEVVGWVRRDGCVERDVLYGVNL